MNKGIKKVLTISSKLSKALAIKSCSVVSTFDSHQPVRPKEVAKVASLKKNK